MTIHTLYTVYVMIILFINVCECKGVNALPRSVLTPIAGGKLQSGYLIFRIK